MTEHEIAFVKKCIRENIHRFYTWGKWKALREQVLQLDKYECQLCKKRGKYTKATTVHHMNYVKKHPDKALEIWYSFRGEKRRNLISLCHDCHEEVHGYRKPKEEYALEIGQKAEEKAYTPGRKKSGFNMPRRDRWVLPTKEISRARVTEGVV